MVLTDSANLPTRTYIFGATGIPSNSDVCQFAHRVASELDIRGHLLATYLAAEAQVSGVPKCVCDAAQKATPLIVGIEHSTQLSQTGSYQVQQFLNSKMALDYILASSRGFLFTTPDICSFAVLSLVWELVRHHEISLRPIVLWSNNWVRLFESLQANLKSTAADLALVTLAESVEKTVALLTSQSIA